MTPLTGTSRLISSTLTAKNPPPNPSSSPTQIPRQNHIPNLPRRNIILLSILSIFPANSATAFSLGISGPKDWLRDQKKKASKFLLGPIDASREYLRAAYLLINQGGDSDDRNKDMGEIQRLLKSAGRDCVVGERNSVLSFQANTGVEVCTFRLIVNNAASLLDNKDPVKLEAEAMLTDLVRSFTLLGGVTSEADLQVSSSRQKVEDALMDTISSLDKFEQGIRDCLEL